MRNAFLRTAYEHGLLMVGCGTRSVRFRPPLTISKAEVDMGLGIIGDTLHSM
jgi:4-aminobutyrate aminotransferase-like enzyme